MERVAKTPRAVFHDIREQASEFEGIASVVKNRLAPRAMEAVFFMSIDPEKFW
jgi:ribosomal protein L10